MNQPLPNPEPVDYCRPGTGPQQVPTLLGALSLAYSILIIIKSSWIGIYSAWDWLSYTTTLDPTMARLITPQPSGTNELILAILELIWLAFGIFLLIAAIKALRRNPQTYLLHWYYAATKIPVILIGAIIEASIFDSDRTDVAIPTFVPFVIAAISLIYPIALIIFCLIRAPSQITPAPTPDRH